MAGGLGGSSTKKSTAGKEYKVVERTNPGARVSNAYLDTRAKGTKAHGDAILSGGDTKKPALGSGQSGPPNPFRGLFAGAGGGGTGGGGGTAGPSAGGGGGGTQPTVNFRGIQELRQGIEPNEFQTRAYEKLEDLYGEVPDYYKQALANARLAGSIGIENELTAAGSRGFGPTSGVTGTILADYGRGLNQQIMGGQLDAASRTFADKMGLATGMGQLGTGIASNMANLYGQNINAYNALANYALGNERNQISWYDAQTRAQQGWMNPMMSMMNMMLQSGMAFI